MKTVFTPTEQYPMVPQPECRHTPQPEDYLAWHAWAEEMSVTHDQVRCPVCGLYAVWVPR